MNKICNSKASVMLIGLVLALSIFALGVLGNEGLGWFASNDKVTANGMGISVDGEFDVVKSVEYYAISSISLDEANNIYTFKDRLPDDGVKSLGQFSTLVAERQLLIKIILNDNVKGVEISAESSASGYIGSDPSQIKKENNSLSSVVELYSVSGSLVSSTDNGYVISSENFQGEPSRFSDVSVDDGNATTDFRAHVQVYQTESGVDDDVVYIIVDYYEAAAEHVMDIASMLEMSGQLSFSDNEDKVITFTPDFTITVAKMA